MDFEKEINDIKEGMEFMQTTLNELLDEKVGIGYNEFDEETFEGSEENQLEIETPKLEEPILN